MDGNLGDGLLASGKGGESMVFVRRYIAPRKKKLQYSVLCVQNTPFLDATHREKQTVIKHHGAQLSRPTEHSSACV